MQFVGLEAAITSLIAVAMGASAVVGGCGGDVKATPSAGTRKITKARPSWVTKFSIAKLDTDSDEAEA